jgi:ferric-dicitrate binding protein FerR (iron transport regulator)
MAAITKNNLTVHEVDAYNYISWKDGVLTLNSQPLSDVGDYLERYYGVEIESCAKADRMKCNGKLILTDSIEDVLNSIAMTMPVKIVKKENKIKITRWRN